METDIYHDCGHRPRIHDKRKRNQKPKMTTTDTPRTFAARLLHFDEPVVPVQFAEQLETELSEYIDENIKLWAIADSQMVIEKELAASQAEGQRLNKRMKKAEDLIKGLHDGWKKARKAHLETCKNAQREIDKLHAENVCLQELIQEFYEWSRRDFPTEQEVREIMDRYHNLLNK